MQLGNEMTEGLQGLITTDGIDLSSPVDTIDDWQARCAAGGGAVVCHEIGRSENGRPIVAFSFGRGPRRISLLAGSHPDEPVGPATLRALVAEVARTPDLFRPVLDHFRFRVIPHVNPDGEIRNAAWIRQWPDPEAYLRLAFREPPGRDVEFGYPDLRLENRRVAEFLAAGGPYHLHVSLHGMGFAEGGMLLIQPEWVERSAFLQEGFRANLAAHGIPLHDHDRSGEKGFVYLGPGFTTTPNSEAMRQYFLAREDAATAAGFGLSSMEYVRTLGGDPLCLVTELPLFLLGRREPESRPGKPAAYLEWRRQLPGIRRALEEGERIAPYLQEFGIRPLAVKTAVELQLGVIDLGLTTVADR